VTQLKYIAVPLALACVMIASGCAEKKPADEVAANSSVTDLSAAPAEPAPVATTPQPVIYDTAPAPQVIAAATPTTPGGSGKYTVQKGDTLWKIATSQYGDGKQWQRITAANPGLSPETLKAGQTITIP
jgi:nucleoid-associated protein YgaU